MVNNGLSRRRFLQLGATGAAALAVGGGLLRQVYPARGQEVGTITVYWNPGHVYNAYQAVIDQFQEDFPGWTVNWERYQWPDMRTKILADFAAGSVPDLMAEPGGWVQEFALSENIMSLQSFIERDGEAMGFPDDWQEYTVTRNSLNGDVYGVQIHLTCALLFYNVDLLAAAGFSAPPTDWDSFLEVAQATTQGNVFGFAPNQAAAYGWPWFLQNGVRYYDPETNQLTMNTSEAVEALQFQADLIHRYNAAPIPLAASDYEGPQRLFSAQRAAMIITGPWDIRPILEGSPNLNWSIAQALTRREQSTSAAGVSLMIPAAARNPEMGWELLKRFVALDTEIAASQEAGMTMPRLSWAEHPDVLALERVAPFGEGLSYALDYNAGLRLTGKIGEIESLYNRAYEQAIYTNRPAEEALNELVEQANLILQSDSA